MTAARNAGERRPTYAPRDAFSTRVSAAEADLAEVDLDEHAPTGLDGARLTDDMLASWVDARAASPQQRPSTRPAEGAADRPGFTDAPQSDNASGGPALGACMSPVRGRSARSSTARSAVLVLLALVIGGLAGWLAWGMG